MNFYNENDPKAAAWLRQLIAAGLIPPGVVDERSIEDVRADELLGFTQCHFFAGISGWSLALQLAGWGPDRQVWTGSCPCQSFSNAGKRKGTKDERHFWPAFFRLIRECKPLTVIGEQVESAIGHGWLDGISADLEGEGYAVGAAVLGAHSVGAPHIRQRLYWLAESNGGQRDGIADGQGRQRNGSATGRQQGDGEPECRCEAGRLADGECEGLEGLARHGDNGHEPGRVGEEAPRPATLGSWSSYDLIPCRDGKQRRIPRKPQSGVLALADGLPDDVDAGWRQSDGQIHPLAKGVKGRSGILKGAGNAIVPELAAEFIRAYLDVTP